MVVRRLVSTLLVTALLAGGATTMSARAPAPAAASTVAQGNKTVTLAGAERVTANADGTFTATFAPTADYPASKTGWAMVLSGHPGNTFWGGDGENIAKVGRCPESLKPERECGLVNIGVARSYFNFWTNELAGKHILRAEFNAFETGAPSCRAREVQAWGTTPVDSGTTWNNQPWRLGVGIPLGSHHVAYGYSGCPAAWLGFGAVPIVNWSIDNRVPTTTIMLKAYDEGDEYAWKKFATAPTLSVTYNTLPDQPTGLTAEGKACAQAPNEPHVNPFVDNDPAHGLRGPQLAARATDPDGGLLYTQFEWKIRGPGSANASDAPGAASGSTFTIDVPAAWATDGAKLSYRARAGDFIDWGVAWAPSDDTWCDVTIDRTAPNVAPTVASTVYPECGVETCPTGGGIGRTGGFTLGRNGVTDVAGFRFDLHDQPSTFVAATADGTATALVTPPDDGPMDLFVRSVDRAGNVGPMTRYHFFVGPGTPPKAHWRLDGQHDTAVLDDGAGRHSGTITLGPAGWRTGRHRDALWLNGTNSASVTTTNGPTLDTTRTFSVAAWARLDRIGGFPAVVSQDGNQSAGFQLQATPDGRWAFAMDSEDVASGAPPGVRIASPAPLQVGVWTHLAGTYDAGLRQMRLYVNGQLVASDQKTAAWGATGAFTIGRSLWRGQHVDFWPGSIDDVRAYDRALSVEEVQGLATTPAIEEVFFGLDEGTGAGTIDASGNYHHGAFTGGASWVPGRVGGGAVRLDGTGAVTAATASVRTDNSFTVTALVRLDAADTRQQTVVSQDGPLSSGFALQYQPARRKWGFVLSPQDSNAPAWMAAESAGEAQAGEWTHLAGVYDAAKGELRLYVNGALTGSRAGRVATNVPGPILIGRGKQSNQGGAVAYLGGSVDDVHIWSGVRTGDQIRNEFLQPATKRTTPYTGQLSRYTNHAGHHVVTTEMVPPGSHFEASLGMMAPDGAPDTVTIHSCRNGATDYFLAKGGCGEYLDLGRIGQLYNNPPAGVPTIAVYRCLIPGRSHFVSHDVNCEDQTHEFRLGYARSYGKLVRSLSLGVNDHISSIGRVPGHYRPEGSLGLVAIKSSPGGTGLWVCRDGTDTFSSIQSGCEGKTLVRAIGQIWTSPPSDVTSAAEVFRCRASWGDLFDSKDPNCEGEDHTLDRSLGHVVTEL